MLELFIPGPTNVDANVAQSLAKPMIGHRTPEFSELFEEVDQNLKKILYTQNKVFQLTCAATGAWEAVSRNFVGKGVLHVVNGAFSQRWAEISQLCGKEIGVIELPWGKAVKPEQIRERLLTGKFDAIALVHNETSTGVLANLEEISAMLKKEFPDVLFLIDSVSSMAGVKIEIDKLCVDACFASLQKAWGLPPGYSLLFVSDKAMAKSKEQKNKGYYFDLEVYDKFYQKNQTPYTPSIPHIYGLQTQTKRILEEGLENRFERHKSMAKFTRNWVFENGFELFSEEGYHSETLTCVANTREIDVEKSAKILKEKGYLLDKGYGKIKLKTFRISHMGETTQKSLERFLNAFKETFI